MYSLDCGVWDSSNNKFTIHMPRGSGNIVYELSQQIECMLAPMNLKATLFLLLLYTCHHPYHAFAILFMKYH